MTSTLSLKHKEDLRLAFSLHAFSLDNFVAKLVAEGYNETEARQLLAAEVKEYKTELFREKLEQNKREEAKKVTFGVVFASAVIGPVFNITSPLWYMVSFLAAGIAGYYGFKSKPIAGIAGSIVAAVAFPYAYHFYFAGRRSYIGIEILIPMILAILPAILLFFILSKTLYVNVDDN